MRIASRRTVARAGFLLAFPLLGGCAGLGWEDVLNGVPGGGDVRGEVEWVDQRRREIGLDSGWGGDQRIRYDGRTRVIYRQREYRVRDLERGDLVSIRVDDDSRRRRYARVIRVERSSRGSDDRYPDRRRRRFDR